MQRCTWAGNDPLMLAYHDTEWGVPEYDSRALWEKLMLDGFQAGLSWTIILRKRDAFRKAFKNFDPEKVARFGEEHVTRLLGDAASCAPARRSRRLSAAHAPISRCEMPERICPHLRGAMAGGKPIHNSGEILTKSPLSEEI